MAKITDVLLFDRPEQAIIEVTYEASLPQIADLITQGFGTLYEYLHSIGEIASDVPYVMYYKWRDMYEKPITISIGVQTSKLLSGKDEIKSKLIPPHKTIQCMFRGGYGEMDGVYDLMEKWGADRGIEVSGDCCEQYYNGAEFAEEDYLTKVVFPVSLKTDK